MPLSRFQYIEFTCIREEVLDLLNTHGNSSWEYCSEQVEIDDQWAEDIELVTVLLKREVKPV